MDHNRRQVWTTAILDQSVMAKQDTFRDLALAPKEGTRELWRWLYTELRAAILDGRLRAGALLPSSRSLGAQYGLARGTVVTAFEQLHDEGYLETERGIGTRVSLHLAESAVKRRRGRIGSQRGISKRAQRALLGAKALPLGHAVGRAFRSYEPAIDLFPIETWTRVASRVLRRAPRNLYGQGEPGGYMPLRKAIAEYVGLSRGVRCTPRQVIVTAGAQQALDLIFRLLLDEGDQAWIEDPGYPGAMQAMKAAGVEPIFVPVDDEGLRVSKGIELAPKAQLAYVTPSNQFPLGYTMSASRRLQLLKWASSAGSWIVEDEYDAEYRYAGRPVASLHSLDRTGRVLYIGTFTKMLFNALRLGFLVVPEHLIEPVELARSFIDPHPPSLDQAILAEFISDGHFGHHVRKMRAVYLERSQLLIELGKKHLGGILEIQTPESGMKTIGWLAQNRGDLVAAKRAEDVGLEVIPISTFAQKCDVRPGLMLGFAGCQENELRRGSRLLASVLSRSRTTILPATGFRPRQ